MVSEWNDKQHTHTLPNIYFFFFEIINPFYNFLRRNLPNGGKRKLITSWCLCGCQVFDKNYLCYFLWVCVRLSLTPHLYYFRNIFYIRMFHVSLGHKIIWILLITALQLLLFISKFEIQETIQSVSHSVIHPSIHPSLGRTLFDGFSRKLRILFFFDFLVVAKYFLCWFYWVCLPFLILLG